MTILLSAGGSGGHITPLLAIAHELKQRQPELRIVYLGVRGDKLSDVPAQNSNFDAVYLIRAGKFRRYHKSGMKQLFDIPTMAKNIRDFFRAINGTWQSWRILGKVRPDLIFIRGGFVGVPVGISAAMRHIPYITHDSDAVPSLANRIIARWATIHAVALPKELYPYPTSKTVTVGVPVVREYEKVTPELKRRYRQELKLMDFKKILLVTGGGLGAERLNNQIAELTVSLLERQPDLVILHIVGHTHEKKMNTKYDTLLTGKNRGHVIVKGFVNDLYRYSGAADVIVTRAGATTIAEFAIQAKACIVVPNPELTNGHQIKNAESLVSSQAIELISELQIATDGLTVLEAAIDRLLNSSDEREQLENRLAEFAHPQSAQELTDLLLKAVKGE